MAAPENKLELLTETNKLTDNAIYEKLSHFLKLKANESVIIDWIKQNVQEGINDKKFIRILSTAIIEDGLTDFEENKKLDICKLKRYFKLLRHYIEHKLEFQLQCLHAVQAMVNKLGFPKGLLYQIFKTLYTEGVISYNAFIVLQRTDYPPDSENREAAMKELTRFVDYLRESISDSTSTSSSDSDSE